MKMHTSIATAFCAALALAASLPQPAAAVGIGLDPSMQSVALGDAPEVDVFFSDLGGEIVSAYDLDITYDPAVLDPVEVAFTTALGDELFFEVLSDSDLSSPGIVDLAQLSLLPDDVLAALQTADPLVVATVRFDAVGAGTSDLGFVFDAFNDVKGRDAAILPLEATGASITVTGDDGGPGPSPVPEPSAALVFTLGAALVGVRLRSRAPFLP
jgi:hypothetical protein